MSLDDWEDPFMGRTLAERAREFNERRRGKLAERQLLLDYIAPGLPVEEVGGHG